MATGEAGQAGRLRLRRRRPWLRRAFFALGIALLVLVLGSMVFPRLIAAAGQQRLPIGGAGGNLDFDAGIRVVSYNIAHGRGTGSHQALTSRELLLQNLQAVGELLARLDADVVGFQEIDAPSWWSGGFDHLQEIARRLPPGQWALGPQVAGLGLQYGTGIWTSGRITAAESVVFAAGVWTPAKGATVARVEDRHGRQLTVVSLHLHFLQGARQRQQVALLATSLARLPRPLVVMGDFNGHWNAGAGIVADLAERLHLHGIAEEAHQVTFPRMKRSIDWILVSSELKILDHRVENVSLSDHLPVIAELRWRGPEEQESAPPDAPKGAQLP